VHPRAGLNGLEEEKKILSRVGIRIPDGPARSESLYRLNSP
jgi:hypothetical protein